MAKLRLAQPPAGISSSSYCSSRALSTTSNGNVSNSRVGPRVIHCEKYTYAGVPQRSAGGSMANVRWFQSSQVPFESTATNATSVSDQTLFHPSRSMISKDFTDLDKQLRSDVKTMGSILGKLVVCACTCGLL